MIETALKIIEKAFAGKTDKAGKPYIEHLKRVSESCPNIGVNSEVKVIALLMLELSLPPSFLRVAANFLRLCFRAIKAIINLLVKT